MNPEIVLGPPGTGKTTRLLAMVEEELAAGVDPMRIGYVSFTKRAAREAAERAQKKFELPESKFRYFRTLHSLCFGSLGLSNGDVLEGNKLVEFGDWLGVEITGQNYGAEEGSTFGSKPGDRALFMENLARVRQVPLRQLYDRDSDRLDWLLVDRVQRGLVEYKKSRNLYDYTDMLVEFAASDWSPDLEVLFVDEAQDLSRLQWLVVEKLARSARRVVIAGDDDQAIYVWAGADLPYFLSLPGAVTVLAQSWRVPRTAQAVSSDVLARVRHRRPKEWRARDEDGAVTRAGALDHVDLSGDDILILVRNAMFAPKILATLRSLGTIYEWRGHSSVPQSTLTAIAAWEALRSGEKVVVEDVRRVYELMSSGIGVKRGFKTLQRWQGTDEVTMHDLIEHGGLARTDIWHDALDRLPADEKVYLLRARQKGESLRKRPRIRVSTIHGSKGGEADHVVLFPDMAPRTFREAKQDVESEARVFYVAVTRTRRQLTLMQPRAPHKFRV